MRLFFALWPDPEVRTALSQVASTVRMECEGRAVPAASLHVTLAFLGEVDASRVAELADIGARCGGSPFALALDRLGYFRRARIVHACASSVPAALSALAAALSSALAGGGFRTEAREFMPHVTLSRDARRAPATTVLDPVLWHVRHIVLVESVRESSRQVYRPLRRFMLDR